MARDIFKSLPDTTTPLNPTKLNGVFNGEEAMGSIVVEDIECKNQFNAFLFENQTKNGLTLSVATDGKITITGTATANTNFYIPYKFDSSMLNNQYTYSVIGTLTNLGNIGFKLALGGDIDNSLLITPNSQKRTFTMTQDFINNVGRFDIYIKKDKTVDTSFYTLLEKGSVATSFTPYKKFGYNSQESMGKIVIDDISSNNKFDINSLEKGHIVSTTGEIATAETSQTSSLIVSDNSVTFTTTDIWKGISSGFMEVKPLTPYYFLYETTSTAEIYFYVSCYDKNKNHLGRATKNGNEFITLENTKYVRWCTQLVAVGTITLTNLQFKDENSSNYIPHVDFKNEIQYLTNFITAKSGYTIKSQNIFRQNNHYWGNVVIQKDSGTFGSTQEDVATLGASIKGNVNSGCFMSAGQWSAKNVGYLYMGDNYIKVADPNATTNNIVKIDINVVV